VRVVSPWQHRPFVRNIAFEVEVCRGQSVSEKVKDIFFFNIYTPGKYPEDNSSLQ
jgi:hypothetical protein